MCGLRPLAQSFWPVCGCPGGFGQSGWESHPLSLICVVLGLGRENEGPTSVSGKCGGELVLGRKWIADWGMFLKGGDP